MLALSRALRWGALGALLSVAACKGDPVGTEGAADTGLSQTDSALDDHDDAATPVDTAPSDTAPNDTSTSDTSTSAVDSPAADTLQIDSSRLDTATSDTATSETVVDVLPPKDGSAGAPKSQEDCPRGRGPTMAFLAAPKRYCIDRSEVTDAQFNVFIMASDKPAAPAIPTYCAAQLSSLKSLSLSTTLPVVNVAWCHAYAYCKWAGKRLCGAHDGGGNPTTQTEASAYSQWSYACRGGDPGTHYPYGGGASYVAGTCVGDDASLTRVKPVDDAQYAGCHGSGDFASLMHMAGNAREWEDSCDNTGAIDQSTSCRARGGAWTSPWNLLNCGATVYPVTKMDDTTGFRCCFDGT